MSKRLTIAVESKSYKTPEGPIHALGKCHLSIEPGELMVLLGPSGCGKTTLIRLILGLDLDYVGQIRIDGEPVHGPGPDRGVVFQEPRLVPWMTLEKNVGFGIQTMNGTEATSANRVSEVIDLVGLTGFERRWPRELSGGMAQRAALARALVNVPSVLVLDEPFGALDPKNRAMLQDQLLELVRKTGTTTLMVTHDVDEALYLGDRIAVMEAQPGRVTSALSVEVTKPRRRGDPLLASLASSLYTVLLDDDYAEKSS